MGVACSANAKSKKRSKQNSRKKYSASSAPERQHLIENRRNHRSPSIPAVLSEAGSPERRMPAARQMSNKTRLSSTAPTLDVFDAVNEKGKLLEAQTVMDKEYPCTPSDCHPVPEPKEVFSVRSPHSDRREPPTTRAVPTRSVRCVKGVSNGLSSSPPKENDDAKPVFEGGQLLQKVCWFAHTRKMMSLVERLIIITLTIFIFIFKNLFYYLR